MQRNITDWVRSGDRFSAAEPPQNRNRNEPSGQPIILPGLRPSPMRPATTLNPEVAAPAHQRAATAAAPSTPQSPSTSRIVIPLSSFRPWTSLNRRTPDEDEDELAAADPSPLFTSRKAANVKPLPPGDESSRLPTTAKKLGRPKGSKNKTLTTPSTPHGKENAAAKRGRPKLPVTENDQTVKRKPGRPPKTPDLGPRALYRTLKPERIVFYCEWERCKAELMNLEVLRKHVEVVHLRSITSLQCAWNGCFSSESRPTFANPKELSRHVHQRHIKKIQRRCGDGPRNTLTWCLSKSETGLPPYLFDKDGNQVTHSIKDQQIEDHATRMKNRARLKWLLQKANDALPDPDSDSN